MGNVGQNDKIGIINDIVSVGGYGSYPVDIYHPIQPPNTCSAVIFAHGFEASKDYSTWIGEALARNGFIAVLFSVPESRSFKKMIDIRRVVNSIKTSISYLEENNTNHASLLFNKLDLKNIGVMGHSFGAGAVIIAGTEDPRIKAIVSMAPPNGDVMKRAKERYGFLASLGSIFYHNPVNDINLSAQRLTTPIQFQVGSNDRICPPSDSRYYSELVQGEKELIVIEGGNHLHFLDEKVIQMADQMADHLPLNISRTLRVIGIDLKSILEDADSHEMRISVEDFHEESKRHFIRWFRKYLQRRIK